MLQIKHMLKMQQDTAIPGFTTKPCVPSIIAAAVLGDLSGFLIAAFTAAIQHCMC